MGQGAAERLVPSARGPARPARVLDRGLVAELRGGRAHGARVKSRVGTLSLITCIILIAGDNPVVIVVRVLCSVF